MLRRPITLLLLLLATPAPAQRAPSARLTAGERACQQALSQPSPLQIVRQAARARAEALRAGDARGAACALYARGTTEYDLGDPAAARTFAEAEAEAARAHDTWTHAAALAFQSVLAGDDGDAARAAVLLRRAFAAADAEPGPAGREARLFPLNVLGHQYFNDGDAALADTTFARLTREAEAVGARRPTASGAYGQTAIAIDRNDYAAAARHLRRARAALADEGPGPWRDAVDAAGAQLDEALGRPDRAAATLRRLARESAARGAPEASANNYEQLGGIYVSTGRYREAVAAYRAGYRVLDGTELDPSKHTFRLLEARAWFAAGDVAAARRALRPVADSLAAAPFDPIEEALAHLVLARDARLDGRPADAARHAARSARVSSESGLNDAAREALVEEALALEAAGDFRGALAATRAADAAQALEQKAEQARVAGRVEAEASFSAEREAQAARRRQLLWGGGLALALAALAAVGGALYGRAAGRRTVRTREQADALRRANAAQTRFLANISHELRTPLTLLLGPVEDLRDGRFAVAPEARPLLERAAASGQRLRRLIDDLLTLARADAGALALRRQRLDVAAFVRDRIAAFGSSAESAGVALTAEGETADVAADPGHLETVVYNLVANALKFTPAGGTVRVHTRPARGGAEITVADTGIGIAADDLAHLFDRYFQADTAPARAGEGAGLGLALVHEIVTRHGGTIAAESTPGGGTTVRVWLPAGEAGAGSAETPGALPPGTALAPSSGDGLPDVSLPDGGLPEVGLLDVAPGAADDDDRPLVLVVEDNADLRAYLRAILAPRYRVEDAPDGVAGLAAAIQTVPDLVLSDVMMPEMDGVEMLQALKADVRTSHVPVVLLTARADVESRLAGLGAGADDYVAKPFASAEVEARVANLIAGRRALRERWSRRAALDAAPDDAPSQEVAFLEALRVAAEARLADPAFTVDALADDVAMSPRQLARKIKALTDETPGALLRRLRLARAASLLRAGATVAEATDAVGFASRSQFGSAFRAAYGVTPSVYAEAPTDAGGSA